MLLLFQLFAHLAVTAALRTHVTFDLSPPNQIAQKYDPQKEEELRIWIEDITGSPIGPDFQKGLKNGVILCK